MIPERIAELRTLRIHDPWSGMVPLDELNEALDEIERLRAVVQVDHRLEDKDGNQWWCACGAADYTPGATTHRAHVAALLNGEEAP